MGVSCCDSSNRRSKRTFQIEKLTRKKKDLELQSSNNLSHIEDYKIELNQLDNKIKKKENEIKNNKFQLRKDQLYEMANDLISVIKDRKRIEKNIRRIRAFNERIKDNIAVIDAIIQGKSNLDEIKDMNDIYNNVPGNQLEIIKKNSENLRNQKNNDEQMINELESANEKDLDFDVKEHLKNLLADSNCGPLPQKPYDQDDQDYQNFDF